MRINTHKPININKQITNLRVVIVNWKFDIGLFEIYSI